MKLAYYPGCSLHGTAREYDISAQALCRKLDIELEQVDDWNCCGATSAHSLDRDLSHLLAARNIKLIQNSGLDAVIPCAACFSRIRTCTNTFETDSALREEIEKKLEFNFRDGTKFYHLAEFLVNNIGPNALSEHVKCSLEGLKLVCYYGCLLVRPAEIAQPDDMENPQILDRLMAVTGAEVADWPYKTDCCGASLSLSKRSLVANLISRMTEWANEADIEAIVTACPLCFANLEMRQTQKKKIPVFYFTEILALSFGLYEQVKSCLNSHLISTKKLVKNMTSNFV